MWPRLVHQSVLHRDSFAKYASNFLRNSPATQRILRLKRKSELGRTAVKLLDDSGPVLLLVMVPTGVPVVHGISHCVVE
jgi:hypothetical protein